MAVGNDNNNDMAMTTPGMGTSASWARQAWQQCNILQCIVSSIVIGQMPTPLQQMQRCHHNKVEDSIAMQAVTQSSRGNNVN
jgi:hypothetical protein